MLINILKDPFVDPFLVDEEHIQKPRKNTVIYSPFHKILHHREKMIVRKMYHKDFVEDYIDFFGL